MMKKKEARYFLRYDPKTKKMVKVPRLPSEKVLRDVFERVR